MRELQDCTGRYYVPREFDTPPQSLVSCRELEVRGRIPYRRPLLIQLIIARRQSTFRNDSATMQLIESKRQNIVRNSRERTSMRSVIVMQREVSYCARRRPDGPALSTNTPFTLRPLGGDGTLIWFQTPNGTRAQDHDLAHSSRAS